MSKAVVRARAERLRFMGDIAARVTRESSSVRVATHPVDRGQSGRSGTNVIARQVRAKGTGPRMPGLDHIRLYRGRR